MRRNPILLLVAMASFAAASTADSQSSPEPCLTCISIRVGRPIVVRGPGPKGDESDVVLSVIRLPDGKFRAFSGNTIVYAIDGDTPWAIGGPSRPVLGPGPKGSTSECGNWFSAVVPDGRKLVAIIHNEQACNYRDNQTHKSTSVGISTDQGLSWNILGPILSGTEAPQKGKGSGEGDCTAVNGNDGYLYAYCLRVADWRTIVARAPLSDPAPGRWFKWDGTGWNVPGLQGHATPLAGPVGNSAAYWDTGKRFFLLATRGSIRLSVGADPLRFMTLDEPLLHYDSDSWQRPGPTDLYGYPNLIGETGSNRLSDHFFLAYMYLPPGTDFSQRHIVMQDVWITKTSAPVAPQVGVALSRWIKPDGALWTTSGPTIENGNRLAYAYDRQLGFLMTAAPAVPSVKLTECVGPSSGQPDYVLAEEGACAREGFRRLRTPGYLYREERAGTVPLYRCVAHKGNFHFGSSDKGCEDRGANERLLGYMLAK